MSTFKLVVTSPFNNYRRGSEIRDQAIVEKILDKNNPMHSFSRHCRRVKFVAVEEHQYINPVPENKIPEEVVEKTTIPDGVQQEGVPVSDADEIDQNNPSQAQNANEDESIHLSSVKSEDVPAKNLRRKRQ